MKGIVTILILILLIFFKVSSQGQYNVDIGKNYMIPDIGVAGYSTKVEIIAKHVGTINYLSSITSLESFSDNLFSFGNGIDGLYMNNPNDIIKVKCTNVSDSSKITLGPLIVSYDGRLITTHIFVHPGLNPNSALWSDLNSEFRIPISVYANGTNYFIDTFYIVQAYPAYTSNNQNIKLGDGNVVAGQNTGIRSPRGAIIFEDLNLSNGVFGINTNYDCDPYNNGNQAFLPATIISLNDVYIDILDISANGIDAGLGGGGGGAGSKNGVSGNGFSAGGRSCDANNMPNGDASGVSTGNSLLAIVNLYIGNISLNGIPGGVGICDQGGGGGTGFPLGLSGGAGIVDVQTPMIGGFGGGSVGGEHMISGGGTTYGGGGASYSCNGQDGEGNLIDYSQYTSSNGGRVYGNRYIVPLAGGSGGGAGNVWGMQIGGNGGGGGGSISIYAYGRTQINGINANGGDGSNGQYIYSAVINSNAVSGGGGGSGGGVIIGAKNGNFGSNIINIEGGDKGYGGYFNNNPVLYDIISHDGGLGSPGRCRIDGSYVQKIISDSASFGSGPTCDSSHYIVNNPILSGTGDGNPIKIYIKPKSQVYWQLAYEIQSYTDIWSVQLELDSISAIDEVFFVAVLQELETNVASYYTKIPEYIYSQLSTNIYIMAKAPIAVSDTIYIYDQSTLLIDVQSNDIDYNGDLLTTTIIQGPNFGSATVINGNSIQFSPDINFSGNDSIVYVVCDNSYLQLCDTAIVYLIESYQNLPNWTYSITSANHSILIQEATIITINGIQIESGDYIGVFFDSLGTLACGGYQIWEGITTSITAWGEDVGNDGFTAGEQFIWKIWDASENIELFANPTYMPIPPMSNQEFFAVNGLSGLTSLIANEAQEIYLPLGWSYFSTYMIPNNTNIDFVFNEIVSNVVIVKNYLGQTYWPIYGLNLIGNISLCEGYQVKMYGADTLAITGISVQPENEICNIPSGWSFIPYLRKTPAPIVDMMSNIVTDIKIVKNYLGQTYWPIYGVNSIGNMNPGEGYQIKMNNAVSFTYPANTANASKSKISIPKAKHFKSVKISGSNMTLGIPSSVWETEPPPNSEIGIFSQSGHLVGVGVYTGENLAISIWGNDELSAEIDGLLENEKFIIKLWNKETESILEIENWLEGDEFYITNKISVVEKLSIQISRDYQLSTSQLFQNTPNPFSNTTEIAFYIPEKAFVEIELFNLIGEKVENIQAKIYEKGKHSIIYDKKNLSSGVYFYRFSSKDFSDIKIMSVR